MTHCEKSLCNYQITNSKYRKNQEPLGIVNRKLEICKQET